MINLKEAFKGAKTPGDVRTAANRITESIASGKVNADKFSIRNIAEATLGQDGIDALSRMNDEGALLTGLRESVDPVNLSAFTNITGQLIIQGAYEAYKSPEFIGDQLVTAETSREDNTRVPGLTPIDDIATEVKEGQEFPDVKFGEDYIDIGSSVKRGQKIGLTREMIFFDRTGKVMEMARGVGESVGKSKELRTLQVVCGIVNNFTRNGVARNTYVGSSDPRINALSGVSLADWTTFDTIMQAFQAMTDDRSTGEPIVVTPKQVLVCPGKRMTLNRILDATGVKHMSQTATVETMGANPAAGLGLQPISSQWLFHILTRSATNPIAGAGKSAANANDTFFVGDFKKAFVYRTLFPFALIQAKHDKDEFDRDVVMQWRASERGVAYVRAPWYSMRVINAG